MTAMSWKSKTENAAWPPGVFRSDFSLRVWSTIAVDDIDRIVPTAIAVFHGRPRARLAAATTRVVRSTWSPPKPRIGRRSW